MGKLLSVKRAKFPSYVMRGEGKTTQAAKKLLTSIKEKGPLGKKSPFTRKEKGMQLKFLAMS